MDAAVTAFCRDTYLSLPRFLKTQPECRYHAPAGFLAMPLKHKSDLLVGGARNLNSFGGEK
jgi:hypothetical protein